jgi:hypothetical protein
MTAASSHRCPALVGAHSAYASKGASAKIAAATLNAAKYLDVMAAL